MSLNKKQELEFVEALSTKILTITYKSKSGAISVFDVTRSPEHTDEIFDEISSIDGYNHILVYSFKHEHVISVLYSSVIDYKFPLDVGSDRNVGYYAVCSELDITSSGISETEQAALDSLMDNVKVSHFEGLQSVYVSIVPVELLQVRKIPYGTIELSGNDFTVRHKK